MINCFAFLSFAIKPQPKEWVFKQQLLVIILLSVTIHCLHNKSRSRCIPASLSLST